MIRSVPVLAGSVIAGTLVLAGCGGSASPSQPSESVATAAATDAPTTAATPSPTDASGRVAQWYAGTQSLFAAIQHDTEQIASAAGKQDVASLPNLCGQLRADVLQVQGAPTAPDKRIAAAVASAMQDYGAAAQSCLNGDYGAAADSINQGGSALETANSIMANLS